MIMFARVSRNDETRRDIGGVVYDPATSVFKQSSRGKFIVDCTEVFIEPIEEKEERLAIQRARRITL